MPTMVSSAFVIVATCLIPIGNVIARSWVDVIDKSLYEYLLIDPYRVSYAQVADPFNFTDGGESSISNNRTDVSTSTDQEVKYCKSNEVMHIVRMFDSWGDGWDQTTLQIKLITKNDENNASSTDDSVQDDDGAYDDAANDDGSNTDDGRNTDDGTNTYGSNKTEDSNNTDDGTNNDDGKTDDRTTDDAVNNYGGTDDGGNLRANLLSYIGNRLLASSLFFTSEDNVAVVERTKNDNTGKIRSNATASLNQKINALGPNVIFKGSLKDGGSGNASVCIQVGKCYEVLVSGGLWPEEVKWDIRQTVQNATDGLLHPFFLPVAKGMGATSCRFSVVDPVTGERACPFSCEGINQTEDYIKDIINSTATNITKYNISTSFNDTEIERTTRNITNSIADERAQTLGLYTPSNLTFNINDTTTSNDTYSNGNETGSNEPVDFGFTIPESPVRSPVQAPVVTVQVSKDSPSSYVFSANGSPTSSDVPTQAGTVTPSPVPTISLYPTVSTYPTATAFPTSASHTVLSYQTGGKALRRR